MWRAEGKWLPKTSRKSVSQSVFCGTSTYCVLNTVPPIEDDHGNSNSSHVKIFLPKKLLECLPKCSSLPKERHRWNTNEEIAAYLITFEKHEEWLTTSPKTRDVIVPLVCNGQSLGLQEASPAGGTCHNISKASKGRISFLKTEGEDRTFPVSIIISNPCLHLKASRPRRRKSCCGCSRTFLN
ncbi:calmodulin-binding transcription activator 1 isoform X16 [Camelus dromedarius]|uniref:calmodulin-binding transcription activator 1 isoform X16 n=1 Tax=Camelus dromedarius TaxID=9838 RepID=UPI00311996AE